MKTYYNSLYPKFVVFFSQNKTKQNILPLMNKVINFYFILKTKHKIPPIFIRRRRLPQATCPRHASCRPMWKKPRSARTWPSKWLPSSAANCDLKSP